MSKAFFYVRLLVLLLLGLAAGAVMNGLLPWGAALLMALFGAVVLLLMRKTERRIGI